MEEFTSVNFLHISAIRKDEQSKDKNKVKLHSLVCTNAHANLGKPRLDKFCMMSWIRKLL